MPKNKNTAIIIEPKSTKLGVPDPNALRVEIDPTKNINIMAITIRSIGTLNFLLNLIN